MESPFASSFGDKALTPRAQMSMLSPTSNVWFHGDLCEPHFEVDTDQGCSSVYFSGYYSEKICSSNTYLENSLSLVNTPQDELDSCAVDGLDVHGTDFLHRSCHTGAIPQQSNDTSLSEASTEQDFDSPNRVFTLQDPSLAADSAASGALRRCEARVRRLDKLNSVLESFKGKEWSHSDQRHLLEMYFRKNRYCDAIRTKMVSVRLNWLKNHPEILQQHHAENPDLGLSGRARSCGEDVAGELTSLRMVQRQTLQAVESMLLKISEDVPLSHAEAEAALSRARAAYTPAKNALGGAVHMLEQRRSALVRPCPPSSSASSRQSTPPHSSPPPSGPETGRAGRLGDEARAVLEDWAVRHFANPYPSAEEKAALVRMTGLPLRFINNWLSNYRVRVWRPAVCTLHQEDGSAPETATGLGEGVY